MNPKILAIDDEPDILEALAIILKSNGFEAVTASTIESIDWVIQVNPHVILLDMLLIGESGANLCKKLKSDPRTSHIPVVLLSANPVAKLKTLSVDCQADSYLPKPFDITSLISTIKHLLPSC